MTFTNLGLNEPTPMDPAQTNAWATTVNTNMTLIDNAVAGLLLLSVAGGSNVVLTSSAGTPNQARNQIFNFTGTLTGNVQVLYPAGVTQAFLAANSTSGAFTLALGVTNGSGVAAGSTVIIPDGTAGSFVSDGTNVFSAGSSFSTCQVLTSGSSATYTTPSGCRQISVRQVAGGGGGGGSAIGTNTDATNGGSGRTTSFNGVTALGGVGGVAGNSATAQYGGTGGTGGVGSPPGIYRAPGCGGGGSFVPVNANGTPGGFGGGTPFAGGGTPSNPGGAGGTNTGGGGAGGPVGASGASGSGGGGGEYAEFIIYGPAATYTYTVGDGGTSGSAGSGGADGGVGGSGVIIVDEYY